MVKKLIGAAVVLVVLAGAGLWWFVLRDDAPEELSLESRTGSDTTAAGERPESFDGTWTVITGGDTQAGFRITEDLAGGLVDHEAVGRTPDVEGSITIAGASIPSGSFTVDLTSLTFEDTPQGFDVANRANALRGRGLETDQFPEATFALTAPVELDEIPADGEAITTEVTGDLTLHGITRSVTFAVDATIEGDTIVVVSADPVPVALADFDIEKPSAPFVANVADEGSFEFLLVLQRG